MSGNYKCYNLTGKFSLGGKKNSCPNPLRDFILQAIYHFDEVLLSTYLQVVSPSPSYLCGLIFLDGIALSFLCLQIDSKLILHSASSLLIWCYICLSHRKCCSTGYQCLWPFPGIHMGPMQCPTTRALKKEFANLCRLSKAGLGCFNLWTALSNPDMTLFQLRGFASLWLAGSTTTMSGMFRGKAFKRKNKFHQTRWCCFLRWQKKTLFACKRNQSINHLAVFNLKKKNSRKRREMPLFCLFF